MVSESTDKRINRLTIVAENLSKRFNRDWIFKDLNYEFTAGNLYAVTGPNGSGKSTLLQVLWGQVPQSSGKISYLINNSAVPPEEIYAHLSIATPYMDLIDEFTLQEQINFHFRLKKIRDQFQVSELLEIFHLGNSANKFIGNFSSGMKQRLKLGLAFYTDAAVIFLDEPGTNLDSQAFGWYEHELAKLPPSCIVFVASNNPLEYPKASKQLNLLDFKR